MAIGVTFIKQMAIGTVRNPCTVRNPLLAMASMEALRALGQSDDDDFDWELDDDDIPVTGARRKKPSEEERAAQTKRSTALRKASKRKAVGKPTPVEAAPEVRG